MEMKSTVFFHLQSQITLRFSVLTCLSNPQIVFKYCYSGIAVAKVELMLFITSSMSEIDTKTESRAGH